MEEKYPYFGKQSGSQLGNKVWVTTSQVFPTQWVLLHFLMLWEIDGETHVFPK